MNDHPNHAERVAALLSLEGRVSDDRYETYRRRLDDRLRRTAPPRLVAPRWRALASAACLMLALAGLLWLTPDARVRADSSTVVLRQLTREKVESPYPLVYHNLTRCQVVAVVRAGTPLRQQGEQRVPLAVEDVLRNETRKELPAFQCSFAGDPPQPMPDQRSLVYLTFSETKGWGCTDFIPLDQEPGKALSSGIFRCATLLDAPNKPDAKAVYDRMLAGGRGIDEAAGCALVCRPDPRSADALLSQLERLHERLRLKPTPDGRPSNEDVAQVARLAEVLAPLREPRAVVPLMECVPQLPRGDRAPVYRHLPELCESASAEVRLRAQRLLATEILDQQGNARDRAAAAAAMSSVAVPAR